MPWNVVTLKNSVPADWITAAHHAARPAGERPRSRMHSHTCSAPPHVKKIEPTKNVTAVAPGPTRLS